MSAIGPVPCHWCKSDVTRRLGDFHYIACLNHKCAATGPYGTTPETAITAWNRLATPDPAEVRLPPITWSPWDTAHIGKLQVGAVHRMWAKDELWSAYVPGTGMPPAVYHSREAARAALVAAVREGIGGTD